MLGIPFVIKNPNESFIENFDNSSNNPIVTIDKDSNQFKVNGIAKFTRICPHAGCPLNYNSNEKQFVCPCHNSRFNLQGNCIQGPACPKNIRL